MTFERWEWIKTVFRGGLFSAPLGGLIDAGMDSNA